MIYNIVSTDEMDMLLDKCVRYILRKFRNEQAAKHLIDGVSEIYDTLERRPELYKLSEDPFMRALEYHEAKVPEMDYVIVYKIVSDNVYLLGIFHVKEDYAEKMKYIWSYFEP